MPRGFASMSPERRREVQSRGGKAAQATGKCPHWTPEQAGAAGRKARAKAREKRDIVAVYCQSCWNMVSAYEKHEC
jgi:hypothetical protein